MKDQHTKTIRDHNDLFRAAHMAGQHTDIPGRIVITRGIAYLEEAQQQAIFAKVRDFDSFTEDNDPYGEHDFGSITHAGNKVFWKIDYYAAGFPHIEEGSEDPANPQKTCRVLTIMLAEEY